MTFSFTTPMFISHEYISLSLFLLLLFSSVLFFLLAVVVDSPLKGKLKFTSSCKNQTLHTETQDQIQEDETHQQIQTDKQTVFRWVQAPAALWPTNILNKTCNTFVWFLWEQQSPHRCGYPEPSESARSLHSSDSGCRKFLFMKKTTVWCHRWALVWRSIKLMCWQQLRSIFLPWAVSGSVLVNCAGLHIHRLGWFWTRLIFVVYHRALCSVLTRSFSTRMKEYLYLFLWKLAEPLFLTILAHCLFTVSLFPLSEEEWRAGLNAWFSRSSLMILFFFLVLPVCSLAPPFSHCFCIGEPSSYRLQTVIAAQRTGDDHVEKSTGVI